MAKKVTKEDARKVLRVVDAGLADGLGVPKPGKMCVEAAVCYALGEPHGDRPSCVADCVREAKISLNDAGWSSKRARARGLRLVAVAQLGSKGVVDGRKFFRAYKKRAIECLGDEDSMLRGDIKRADSDGWISYLFGDYAANSKSPDKILTLGAKALLLALKDCKSPGCKWLSLCK